jgi:hypothetical protein
MKLKVKVGTCSMHVVEMEMKCPLCGVLVRSGESHACSLPPKPTQKKLKK